MFHKKNNESSSVYFKPLTASVFLSSLSHKGILSAPFKCSSLLQGSVYDEELIWRQNYVINETFNRQQITVTSPLGDRNSFSYYRCVCVCFFFFSQSVFWNQ